jgi:hypothetical protein
MLRRSRGWDLDRFLPQSGGQLRSILPGSAGCHTDSVAARSPWSGCWLGQTRSVPTSLIQATECAASRTFTGGLSTTT